jgi:hypothetical protein
MLMSRRVRGRAVTVAVLAGVIGLVVGSVAQGRAVDAQSWGLVQHEVGARSSTVTAVRIYLVAIGDGGRSGRTIGCGDSLVGVARPVPPTSAPLTAALRLLLRDHRRMHGESGLYNALYRSRLAVRRVAVVGGKATVQLVGTMRLGGVCDDPRVVAQLRGTVLQFRTVRAAVIFINGRPLSSWLSEKGG